ncbi:MAG: hypothetical protein HY678_03600 [Chloroflexi bacterium]|nr:hypothetical protein [Chloroflexota bacterium]
MKLRSVDGMEFAAVLARPEKGDGPAFGFGGAGLNTVVVVPSWRLIVVRTSRVWTIGFDKVQADFMRRVAGPVLR